MMGSGAARGDNRARTAAEAAIRSPLLEDIDFTGARGILVNIAAGMDISLGEFSEVGATIEEFASENATVVIGTVIDTDMEDEMRVTVVATGIGDEMDKPAKVIDNTIQKKVAGDGKTDYADFDQPTYKRLSGQTGQAPVSDADMEFLDVPAFLRRQAD
jgi:cell division protein FtsZ